MNVLQVVNHFNATQPTAKEICEFINENMNNEELSAGLLFIVNRLTDNPLEMMLHHEAKLMLVCLALCATDRLNPGRNFYDEMFNEIVKNMMENGDNNG